MYNNMHNFCFEWDDKKNRENQKKHGITFEFAKQAFLDPFRIILEDDGHSSNEKRWFCLAKVENDILTVRFTYRNNIIRIFGAGFWRKGKSRYEEEIKKDKIFK